MEEAGHQRHAGGRSISRQPVRGAAQLRKRLRRELRRVGATDVKLYIDGPRGSVRVRFPTQNRELHLPVSDALRLLRAVSDGAGAEAALEALVRT